MVKLEIIMVKCCKHMVSVGNFGGNVVKCCKIMWLNLSPEPENNVVQLRRCVRSGNSFDAKVF